MVLKILPRNPGPQKGEFLQNLRFAGFDDQYSVEILPWEMTSCHQETHKEAGE